MKRFFIELSYKGTAYSGWQVQPNGPSVQQTLEEALALILRREVPVTGQGRTDAGVHALKSFAHFELEEAPMDSDTLSYKLNRLLPQDIAIHQIREVQPDAHARFSAEAREYRYFIHLGKSAFLKDTALQLYRVPDLEAMQKATPYILGEHDFTSFCSTRAEVAHKRCTVSQAHWQQDGRMLTFTIRANRFVMNMVRSLTGTMLEIGAGKRRPEDMPLILAALDRTQAGENAAPEGLHLSDVIYPSSIFISPEKQ